MEEMEELINQESQWEFLGDMGWYPLGAILWAYNYELPLKVRTDFVQFNKVDTIVALSGTLWFSNNRMASFDCGATSILR